MLKCYVVDRGEEGVAATFCISLLQTVEKIVDHTGWERRGLLRLDLGTLPIQNRHLAVRADMSI